MVTKTVEVKNEQGLHMRPAGILAAEMKKFAGCTVTLKTADKTAKASAVMQITIPGKCIRFSVNWILYFWIPTKSMNP